MYIHLAVPRGLLAEGCTVACRAAVVAHAKLKLSQLFECGGIYGIE